MFSICLHSNLLNLCMCVCVCVLKMLPSPLKIPWQNSFAFVYAQKIEFRCYLGESILCVLYISPKSEMSCVLMMVPIFNFRSSLFSLIESFYSLFFFLRSCHFLICCTMFLLFLFNLFLCTPRHPLLKQFSPLFDSFFFWFSSVILVRYAFHLPSLESEIGMSLWGICGMRFIGIFS